MESEDISVKCNWQAMMRQNYKYYPYPF